MMNGFNPLANINKEVEDFEDFVQDFAAKMDEIVSGDWNYKQESNYSSSKKILKENTISTPPLQFPPAAELSKEPLITRITSVKSGGKIDYSEWDQLKDDDADGDKDLTQEATVKAVKEVVPIHQNAVSEQVQNLRKAGNAAFKVFDYKKAKTCYSEAINVYLAPNILERKVEGVLSFLDKLVQPVPAPVPVAIYINRALCCINLSEFREGLQDCESALLVEPENVKALYRKYQCLRGLNDFSRAVESLEKCISLTNDSLENQKLVSLTVLKSCLSQVVLLAKDKEKATALLGTASDIQQALIPILESLKSRDQSTKELAQISLLFASFPDSLHIFRELGGFGIISKTEFPSRSWSLLIRESCQGTPENIRDLSQYIVNVVDSICIIGEIENDLAAVLDDILQLLFLNEPLRIAIIEKSKNPNLGPLLEKCLQNSTISIKTKSSIFCWLSFVIESKSFVKVFKVLNISLELAVSYAISNFNQLDLEAVRFFFRLSLSRETIVQRSLEPFCSMIVQTLFMAAINKKSSCVAMDELSTIYNLANNVNRDCINHDFISFLCKTGHEDAMKIKILAKIIGKCDRGMVQIVVDNLDWQKLRGAVDLAEESASDLAQVLAVVLKCDPKTYCTTFESVLPVLLRILKMSNNLRPRLIGNTALALGEFADFDSFREKMLDLGAMEIVIEHLRVAKERSVQKNLAIVCAKLCKNSNGLEVARSMQAIPLIASFRL